MFKGFRKPEEQSVPDRAPSRGNFRGMDMVLDVNAIPQSASAQRRRPPGHDAVGRGGGGRSGGGGSGGRGRGGSGGGTSGGGGGGGEESYVASNTNEHGMTFKDGLDAQELDYYWRVCQEKIAAKDQNNNIVVVTRTRPFTTRERDAKTPNCVRVINDEGSGQDQIWVVNPSAPEAGPQKFSFDYCMDSFNPRAKGFVGQKAMFETIGLDMLSKVWTGYNSSIFAYGQTGSGKTYSIMGFDTEKGIIPRMCEALFYFLDTHGGDRRIAVEATYLEIYQEKIIDLLNPHASNSGPLKPKDRLKLESQRRKLMKDRSNAANMEKAREILKQLSPTYVTTQIERTKQNEFAHVHLFPFFFL